MILRKPYAFLIKNFKKIHVVLLLLFAYIFYKHMQLYSFVREYVSLQSYSATNNPISNYVSFLPYLSIILMIGISIALLALLRYKEKPWKLYLIIIAEYILMFVAFNMASNYFGNYTTESTIASAMAVRDLLFISSIPQYFVLLILIIRITGIDLNKFSFTTDKEYIELSSDDREEFEINVDVDKESFKRTFRKLRRNLHYFYQEHKFIMNVLITVLIIGIVAYSYYYIAIVHKVYKQGDTFDANNYSITVNKAYYTDKDYAGSKITNSNFVILDVTVKNNYEPRTMKVDSFHIMNKDQDYTNTTYYNKSFTDLGTPYETFEFKRDQEKEFLLIFKVDKKLDINNYTLFYQQTISADNIYLRKIKLKLEDLRKIETEKPNKLEKSATLKFINGKKEKISIDDYTIASSFNYNYYGCPKEGCGVYDNVVYATEGTQILKLDLNTSLESKELVDFSSQYGKINYVNSNNKNVIINAEDSIKTGYLGKSLYLKVPADMLNTSKLRMIFTIRNKKYIFDLK